MKKPAKPNLETLDQSLVQDLSDEHASQVTGGNKGDGGGVIVWSDQVLATTSKKIKIRLESYDHQ